MPCCAAGKGDGPVRCELSLREMYLLGAKCRQWRVLIEAAQAPAGLDVSSDKRDELRQHLSGGAGRDRRTADRPGRQPHPQLYRRAILTPCGWRKRRNGGAARNVKCVIPTACELWAPPARALRGQGAPIARYPSWSRTSQGMQIDPGRRPEAKGTFRISPPRIRAKSAVHGASASSSTRCRSSISPFAGR